MKLLFSLGHPAHFHLFRNVIHILKQKGHMVSVHIKTKDVLEELVKKEGWEYYNILPEGRKNNKLSILLGLLKRDFRLWRICRKERPDLMIGTNIETTHVGRWMNIPSINVNEDDWDVVPFYARFAYPFASVILAPEGCRTGKWEYKTIHYPGYHELAYLHPSRFRPDHEIVKKYLPQHEKYFLMRFSGLAAHHDRGIHGINTGLADKIIRILNPHGKVIITSERILEPQFEALRMNIDPADIHHLMGFAEMFIGDSQTMSAEAGVLGIPFIRFNNFVGRISYLNELENKYELGFGFTPGQEEHLLLKLDDLIRMPDRKAAFQAKRKKMLDDKTDVCGFLTSFIENYPLCIKSPKPDPGTTRIHSDHDLP